MKKDTRRVAFSYDITSNRFWNDLDSSDIGWEKDEKHKDDSSYHPVSILDDSNTLADIGDSEYSLAKELKRK